MMLGQEHVQELQEHAADAAGKFNAGETITINAGQTVTVNGMRSHTVNGVQTTTVSLAEAHTDCELLLAIAKRHAILGAGGAPVEREAASLRALDALEKALTQGYADPVMLDSLMLDRINRWRRRSGFQPVSEEIRTLEYAEQLKIGSADTAKVKLIHLGD